MPKAWNFFAKYLSRNFTRAFDTNHQLRATKSPFAPLKLENCQCAHSSICIILQPKEKQYLRASALLLWLMPFKAP